MAQRRISPASDPSLDLENGDDALQSSPPEAAAGSPRQHPATGAPQLLATKLFVPRPRPDLVARPRLLARSSRSRRLPLHAALSARRGQDHAPGGLARSRCASGRLAQPRRARSGRPPVPALSRRRAPDRGPALGQAALALARCSTTAAASGGGPDRLVNDLARSMCTLLGSRRLPPGPLAPPSTRPSPSCSTPAAARASRDRNARGPAAAAPAPARSRPGHRDSGRRPELHPRRGGALPGRQHGAAPDGRASREAGRPDRGLGGRTAARRAGAARSGRSGRVRGSLRRWASAGRRLPGDRRARPPARAAAALPARDQLLDRLCAPLCDALLAAGRRRSRRLYSPSSSNSQETLERWSGPTCSWSRWTTSGAGTAITASSSTSLRARLARELGPERSRAPPAGERLVARAGLLRRRFSTPWRPVPSMTQLAGSRSLLPTLLGQGSTVEEIERWLTCPARRGLAVPSGTVPGPGVAAAHPFPLGRSRDLGRRGRVRRLGPGRPRPSAPRSRLHRGCSSPCCDAWARRVARARPNAGATGPGRCPATWPGSSGGLPRARGRRAGAVSAATGRPLARAGPAGGPGRRPGFHDARCRQPAGQHPVDLR